jgi:hypothetical protein
LSKPRLPTRGKSLLDIWQSSSSTDGSIAELRSNLIGYGVQIAVTLILELVEQVLLCLSGAI